VILQSVRHLARYYTDFDKFFDVANQRQLPSRTSPHSFPLLPPRDPPFPVIFPAATVIPIFWR